MKLSHHLWLILLLAVCAAHGVYAAPRLEVVGGVKQELGVFAPGIYHGSIKIANIGDSALQILAVRSSCGCLYGSMACKILKPGDTCDLEWHLSQPAGRSGRSTKTVVIETNDPASSHTIISFSWEGRVELSAIGGVSYIILNCIDTVRNVWKGELTLKNMWTDTLTVSPPTFQNSDNLELRELGPSRATRLLPGDTMKLSVVVGLVSGKSGTVAATPTGSGAIRFHTSGRYTPDLDIAILAYPQPR